MLSFISNPIQLTRDLLYPVQPEQILYGNKLFRSFMKFQTAWCHYFYPNVTLDEKTDSWFYLQKFIMPLIVKHASFYHLSGINKLKLNHLQKPDFKEFSQLFFVESNGFQLEPVNHELAAKEYFSIIKEKKFPCIEKMRFMNELFCALEPDFWHEAIGHIAPLCFKEVQQFYLDIAEIMLTTKNDKDFNKKLALAWTLTEYGFIKENGQHKMFGAALVGSHLAHMRYLHNIIRVEAADPAAIIGSQFYSETAAVPKNTDGTIRFFSMDHLDVEKLFSQC